MLNELGPWDRSRGAGLTAWHCILADPPWNESGGGGRGAQNHYRLIKKREDIFHTMRHGRFSDGCSVWTPDRNSHLWLWVTNNFLCDGLWLMGQLGYRYVTNAVWCKTRQGLGQYLRGQHELCLFGVRGRLPALTAVPSVFGGTPLPHPTNSEGKIIHSRKPPEARAAIEQVSPGPRLELFARITTPGWTVWGDETDCAMLGQQEMDLEEPQ